MIYVWMYLIAGTLGPILEWCYGTLWNVCGITLWIYPDSSLRYTSWEIMPIWGFWGPLLVVIYKALQKRSFKPLVNVIFPLLGAVVVVILISLVLSIIL